MTTSLPQLSGFCPELSEISPHFGWMPWTSQGIPRDSTHASRRRVERHAKKSPDLNKIGEFTDLNELLGATEGA
jgi:hypothetical protein